MIKHLFAYTELLTQLIIAITCSYFVRKSINDITVNGFDYYALSIFLFFLVIYFLSALRCFYLAEKLKNWRTNVIPKRR